jgi:hypothetical protein
MKRLLRFLGLVGIFCLTAWAQERGPVIERDSTLLQNSRADEADRMAQRHGGPMPSVITVTRSANSGPGTLRQALSPPEATSKRTTMPPTQSPIPEGKTKVQAISGIYSMLGGIL